MSSVGRWDIKVSENIYFVLVLNNCYGTVQVNTKVCKYLLNFPNYYGPLRVKVS